MKKLRIISAIALVMVVTLMVGCGRIELYQDLTERDANEILVLLSENGLKASKKKSVIQNEISYSVEVPEKDMVRARGLLVRHNLPRRKELGLTGVYKEKGLIPTPDEQKARFLLAMKGEIINSLERIPLIVDADVVLNVPVKDEFADAEVRHIQRPTASVVIRAKPLERGLAPLSEARLQQFVANAIEGMNPRDVAVVIDYLPMEGGALRHDDVRALPDKHVGISRSAGGPPPPVFSNEIIGLRLDEESRGRLKIYLLIFFLILILLSSALIIAIIQGSRMRRTLAQMRGGVGELPAIEGHVMDDGPPGLTGGDEDEL